MTPVVLDVSGIRVPDDITLMRFAVKSAAVAALRPLHLGPTVAPVRARTRFGSSWMVWALPVGDPGEALLLLTHQKRWVQLCATGCVHIGPGCSHCPGHLMSVDESHVLTLAIAGHRTRILTIGTVRAVECFDWLTGRAFTDYADAGNLYRAACLCGWRSERVDQRPRASRAAELHRDAHP